MATTPLCGFVASSRGLLQEEGSLPKARTSDGFDSNGYKLVKRSGYGFSKLPLLESVIEERPYGLNDTQKMVQKQGGGVVTTKNWTWLCTIPIGENFKTVQRGAVSSTIHHDGRS